ncbi:MAG TPA: 2OG-Fe(II) oxygenase [Candidatus Sulfotelmatobacter sp.]|nr:2OG-Fe(II) oxygenase [Candidatus Sulfotelmatobacter sp.]
MTPKQILDSFSETLIQDERILSAQEHALVSTLLQHAKAATDTSPQVQEAVKAVMASAVGEIVAQRAFTVLGGSIVERILEGSSAAVGNERSVEVMGPKDPQTPTAPGPGVRAPRTEPQPPSHATPRGPQPPHPGTKEPQPPSHRAPTAPGQPQPPRAPMGIPGVPSPSDPQTPTHGVVKTIVSQAGTAVADRPEALPARCVVLDEFLAPQELAELTRFTLEHEKDFQVSEVLSPHADDGIVNYEHRRSRVLMDLERHQDVMLERIKTVLPEVLRKLDMEEFSISGFEAQITASNDGDYFHFHSDNASDRVASRYLTFVYFFHREPRPFEGGELRIHDAHLEQGTYVSEGSYQTIEPRQNQIVFFPCQLMHEITPLHCPSQQFADSRFTVNGWLRR